MQVHYNNDMSILSCYSLEIVWFGEFSRHFARYPQHHWTLEPINDPRDVDGDGVHTWQDSAKVRFCCPVSRALT